MRTARDLRSVLHEALYALDSGSQLKNLLFLLVRTTNIPGLKPKPSEFPADLNQSVASQSIPAKTASKSIGLRLSLKA